LLQGIKRATLHSQAIGTISEISANLGTEVKAGQVLLSLENSVQAASLKHARGAYQEAELSYSANKRLFNNSSAISKAEYMRSQIMFLATQTALASAQKSYDDRRIIAPFDGIITNVNDIVQRGNNTSVGQPMFSIVDISKIKVSVSLGEREIGRIKKGAAARVKVSAANTELEGVVLAVSSGSDSQTGAFTIEAIFDNPGLSVKDGMSGIISIETDKTRYGIAIPSSVLINNRSLLLAKNGKVQNVAVDFESVSGGRVLIRSGIEAGDTIIISGTSQLADGDLVALSVTNATPTQ
jgi:membrane fusion protein (multidrug efflux system)